MTLFPVAIAQHKALDRLKIRHRIRKPCGGVHEPHSRTQEHGVVRNAIYAAQRFPVASAERFPALGLRGGAEFEF